MMINSKKISVIKINAGKMGFFYIFKRNSSRNSELYDTFMNEARYYRYPKGDEKGFVNYIHADDLYFVYCRFADKYDMLPNIKDPINLSELLRNRLCIAYSGQYDKLRLQSDDTRYYTVVISADDLSSIIVDLFKSDESLRVINSVKSYDKMMPDKPFYRGHTSCTYKLLPSLFRGEIKQSELNMYKDFTEYCSDYEKRSAYEKMTFMQHYGLPTRLLDTTTNKYVALFMACTYVFSNYDSIYDIGEVFAFTENDIVSADSEVVNQLCKVSCGEMKKEDVTENIDRVLFIEKTKIEKNERLDRQEGSFILFGNENEENIKYESVIVTDKKDILEELDKMGINERRLVPELEHVCHYIKEKYSGEVENKGKLKKLVIYNS